MVVVVVVILHGGIEGRRIPGALRFNKRRVPLRCQAWRRTGEAMCRVSCSPVGHPPLPVRRFDSGPAISIVRNGNIVNDLLRSSSLHVHPLTATKRFRARSSRPSPLSAAMRCRCTRLGCTIGTPV